MVNKPSVVRKRLGKHDEIVREIAALNIHMASHAHFGSLGVAVENQLHDLPMLCVGFLDSIRKMEAVVTIGFQSPAERSNLILQNLVLASAIESVVERQIVPAVLRRITARRRRAPEFLHSGEFGFVLRRHAASTQLRTQALKMAHHFVHLRELRQGHRRGEHALVRAIPHESRGHEAIQDLSDWRSRYAEPNREFSLVEAPVSQDSPADDVLFNGRNDL